MNTRLPRVAVVGAGIVGAAIARYLARRGARVTLVEGHRPAAGVTGQAFGWLNVAHGVSGPHAQLRHLAIEEYRRLEHELDGALRVDWCGALTWHDDPTDTERFAREHADGGYEVRLLSRQQIAGLEPNLLDSPSCAAYAASEGAVDPATVTETLIRDAQAAGAEVLAGTEAVALQTGARGITGLLTRDGELAAEVVVLAAGTGSRALCEPLGIVLPVEVSPALRLRFSTPARLVNTVISGPQMEVRQATTTTLLAAEDFPGDAAGNHPRAIAERTLAALRASLHGGSGVALAGIEMGLRPMPADGAPIVGFDAAVDGLYLAVMHSGVTLAPAVARLAAAEILDGVLAPMLAGCRVQRFAD